MSSGWLPRLLKAWVRVRMELLVLPPETAPAPVAPHPPAALAAPAEEAAAADVADVSKLRGPSCSGTFLISMLSLRSMRGTPEPSPAGAGESGEEDEEVGVGVGVPAASDEDDLLL